MCRVGRKTLTRLINQSTNYYCCAYLMFFFVINVADNAIPIQSWFSDPTDLSLLNLLPMLDALRFCSDVRSVLSRNLHLHRF